MSNNDEVTVSFFMERPVYEKYKSIINKDGKTVKGDLVKYMRETVDNNKKLTNRHITPEDTAEVYFAMAAPYFCYIIITNKSKKMVFTTIERKDDNNKSKEENCRIYIRKCIDQIVEQIEAPKIFFYRFMWRGVFDFSGIEKDIILSSSVPEDSADCEAYAMMVDEIINYYAKGEKPNPIWFNPYINELKGVPEDILKLLNSENSN